MGSAIKWTRFHHTESFRVLHNYWNFQLSFKYYSNECGLLELTGFFLTSFQRAPNCWVPEAGFILPTETLREAHFTRPLATGQPMLSTHPAQLLCYGPAVILYDSGCGFLSMKIHFGSLYFCAGDNTYFALSAAGAISMQINEQHYTSMP